MTDTAIRACLIEINSGTYFAIIKLYWNCVHIIFLDIF